LKCCTKEEIDLDETEEEKKTLEELKQAYEPVCKKIKEILDNKVEKVVVGFRMEDSPCVLVTTEHGWTANMERIMKAQALRDSSMTSYMVSKKIMEINPKHGIVKELKSLLDKDQSNSTLKDIVWLLYDTSLLNSGFSIEDPNTFAKRMHKMLLFGLQDDTSLPPEVDNSTNNNSNNTSTTETKNTFLDECD
jgi:molecular chaperone HtpG